MRKWVFHSAIIITASLLSLSCSKKDSSSSSSSTNNTPGTAKITATWNVVYNGCNSAWSVLCGVANTQADATNGTFFKSNNGYNGNTTFVFGSLNPGTYYYKASKVYNTSCGGSQATVNKIDSFTITAGQTTTISISL